MTHSLGNPASRASEGRGSELISLATKRSEDTPSTVSLQLSYLARRVGMLDPATIATIAFLAFGEVRQ